MNALTGKQQTAFNESYDIADRLRRRAVTYSKDGLHILAQGYYAASKIIRDSTVKQREICQQPERFLDFETKDSANHTD